MGTQIFGVLRSYNGLNKMEKASRAYLRGELYYVELTYAVTHVHIN